jgi:hypothetical protein
VLSDYIEQSVPLKAVAAAARMDLAELVDEAQRLAIHVGTSWDGQPSMAELDAQRLVSGEARRTAEYDQARAAYLAAEQRWQAERQRIWQDAYFTGFNKAGGPRAGRASDEAGREAARAAVEQYESTTPAPRWGGLSAASLFARVASKLTGSGAPR